MSRKRRTFKRPLGERRYKKLFIVAVEGVKTEPQYFSIFNHPRSIISVKCLRRKQTNSAPRHVLKEMENYLRKKSLKKTDEAWVVVDVDAWTEDQLKELIRWEKKDIKYGVALSNPNFEYWLLLHFEDGRRCVNPQNRLKKYLPNYKKEIDCKKFTLDRVRLAIERAKPRDTQKSNDLPQICSTTVYKLVRRIIDH